MGTIKPTKLLHVLCDWSTISSIISQLSSTETHLTKFMTKSKLLSKHIPKTQFGCQPMKCFRTKTKKNYYYYLFFFGVSMSALTNYYSIYKIKTKKFFKKQKIED